MNEKSAIKTTHLRSEIASFIVFKALILILYWDLFYQYQGMILLSELHWY